MRIEEQIVAAFANKISEQIVTGVVRSLKKMNSDHEMLSGNSGLKNVWEEICVQVQGEESFNWSAYIDVMERMLYSSLERLLPHEQIALWALTEEGWDYIYDYHADDVDLSEVPVSQDENLHKLRGELLSKAADYENARISKFLERIDY